MAKTVKALETPDLSQRFTTTLLGQAIRAKRTQSKLTQADAADLCGISKQTYVNIEQGKGDVRLSSIIEVVAGLGIKINIAPWQDLSGKTPVTEIDGVDDDWV